MKVVIVDSGVNLSHKVFKKSISNIKSLQYESETITCTNQDNDLFGHGTAVTGIISKESPEAGVKHFRLSDGSYIAAVYNEPVHYLQDGRYEEIDNTLRTVTIDGKVYYRNTAGELMAQLPQTADGEVQLNYNGYSVSWVIDGMADSFGTKISPEPDRTARCRTYRPPPRMICAATSPG